MKLSWPAFLQHHASASPRFTLVNSALVFALLIASPAVDRAEPSPQATVTFNSYATTVESRLASQHRFAGTSLAASATDSQSEIRLRRGELIIEKITPPAAAPGSMLHHWRGTAFAPGATVAEVHRILQDYSAYPQRFAPQVLKAAKLSGQGDHIQASMRVRQKHVITVVMDTTYDITYAHPDARHGYSLSRSTQVSEIASPGTPSEHALGPGDDHGFLWRQNTYWTYEERDGGLYMQIESISLSRAIPHGLAWAVGPFVESVPRESLEFTLRSVCDALRKP